MSIPIILGATDKERNSTKIPQVSDSYDCLLKRPTSIIRPVVQLKIGNPAAYNYAYIPILRRWYYIVDMTSINADMWEFQLEVDVLATYRADIIASDAFIQYSQSAYDTMIPDSRLPKSDRCSNTQYEFPLTFWDEDGSIILSVVSKTINGRNGMAESYAMTPTGMSQLAQVFIDPNIMEQLKQYFDKPLEMVLTATWVPVHFASIGGVNGSVVIGDYETGVTGKKLVTGVLENTVPIDVEVPYEATLPDGSKTYADFRNCEPYTQYVLELPGAGSVEIPMISLLEDGSSKPHIMLRLVIDLATGDIVYRIQKSDETLILLVGGSVGVAVPVANNAQSPAVAAQSGVATLLSTAATVGAIVSGNVPVMLGGMAAMNHGIGQLVSSAQHNTMATGSLGSKASAVYSNAVRLVIRPYTTSDSVSNVARCIGAPLFARRRLGSLSGFVKCNGVRIKCECTQEEHLMLSAYLEASANYTYGGVIIE